MIVVNNVWTVYVLFSHAGEHPCMQSCWWLLWCYQWQHDVNNFIFPIRKMQLIANLNLGTPGAWVEKIKSLMSLYNTHAKKHRIISCQNKKKIAELIGPKWLLLTMLEQCVFCSPMLAPLLMPWALFRKMLLLLMQSLTARGVLSNPKQPARLGFHFVLISKYRCATDGH